MPQALELCTPFSDHMVLQRGRSHHLWGWDHPEQVVELVVTLGGKAVATASGRADVHGRFKLTLAELGVGGPYTLTLRGSSAVTLNDVMVGEVWLASGQSNMEWRVAASDNADAEILAADHPEIRVLKVEPRASLCPTRRAGGLCQVSSPETVGVPARGRIDGEQVVVVCPGVAEPVTVRYAWDDCPSVNLINRAGLPALAFRTDAEPAEP